MTDPCSPADFKALQERVASLDRLFTTQLRAQDEKVQLALAASKEAVSKAETATERRFEGVNEFRATLADQAQTFASKAEMRLLTSSLDEVKSRVSNLLLTLLATIIGTLVGALILVGTRR